MLKHLISLSLICLLLCGCAVPAPSEDSAPTLPDAAAASPPERFCRPGSPVEQRTQGAVQVYPLNRTDCTGLGLLGESVLLFSGKDTTTLTLIDRDGFAAASADLGIWLAPDDPSLKIGADTLWYYDHVRGEMVILDQSLRKVSGITVPGDLMGTPVLSSDHQQLYYCTPTALRAMEVDTGIRRCIREMAHGNQSVSALLMEDTILACSISDETGSHLAYISAENGRLLEESRDMELSTADGRYYAAFPTGAVQALLFGTGPEPPQALTPADLTARCWFLPAANAVVSAALRSGDQMQLDYYDLSYGLRSASLTLDAAQLPASVASAGDGYIYLLLYSSSDGCDAIYRWEVSQTQTQDQRNYTGAYFTAREPDLEGLDRCRDLADQIGQRHGIRVLIWEEAAAAAPWDYAFEAEYLVPVIAQALTALDRHLSQFPPGLLADTAASFDGLTICLVRQLTASEESGNPTRVNGLQYFLDGKACIAIAAGQEDGKAFFHELYHVMETRIFAHSIALDQWETLNPNGFTYDLDYRKNRNRDASAYLLEDTRCFIDAYSMSFPREDRARIMEYACTPGNERYFRSEPMQKKLRTLCQGIREAYGLEKSGERYLWEQYLYVPMA